MKSYRKIITIVKHETAEDHYLLYEGDHMIAALNRKLIRDLYEDGELGKNCLLLWEQ